MKKKIQSIFIANRGEIAVRIAKTAKEMGIRTVAPFSPDDKKSLHVKEVDKAIGLSNIKLSETFLSPDFMVELAIREKCDAIHPGYGFLAEDYRLAELCKRRGLIFIGPDPEVIRIMGDKSEARKIALDAGVPVLPVFEGEINELAELSSSLGFPVMIKAVSGGGGKGLRKVNHIAYYLKELERAGREAMNYFGSNRLLIEPYIKNARHVEVQILADFYGNVIHLFERECSIQRNHQKIIEESPALNISSELKQKLFAAAFKIAQKADYSNAGTIEFLIDEQENFFFLEMNTRIQVEHGVSEMVTGIDIVKKQICIASGERLNLKQDEIKCSGHSVEARIYAEDPFYDFRREPGCTGPLFLPECKNLRIDSNLTENSCIPESFDPLLAKLISYGSTRKEAISLLSEGLKDLKIPGINHNAKYIESIIGLNEFLKFRHNTETLKNIHNTLINKLLSEREKSLRFILAGYLIIHFSKKPNNYENIWKSIGYWRQMNKVEVKSEETKHVLFWKKTKNSIEVDIDNVIMKLDNISVTGNEIQFCFEGNSYLIYFRKEEKYTLFSIHGFTFKLRSDSVLSEVQIRKQKIYENKESGKVVVSPLFGKVIKINYRVGQIVKKGDPLI
ncbi:MAG: carbamoyl-phosphate synthase subunit L, partial [Prolixibacteraceae bacterium]|nr:carbamoyl-phosphate synthase subunit L [Prolixibacteraceae bacterium]